MEILLVYEDSSSNPPDDYLVHTLFCLKCMKRTKINIKACQFLDKVNTQLCRGQL